MNDHWKTVRPRVAERAKLAAYGKEQRKEMSPTLRKAFRLAVLTVIAYGVLFYLPGF